MYIHCAEDVWYVICLIHFIVIVSCNETDLHYFYVECVACRKHSGRNLRLD